jgi:hypothetical protein
MVWTRMEGVVANDVKVLRLQCILLLINDPSPLAIVASGCVASYVATRTRSVAAHVQA